MLKVKTFRFVGSECEYANGKFKCLKDDVKDIDTVINNFLSKHVKELVDIKIVAVENRYHNNGGYNNVDLIYTIIYK